jgi:hypothetical protein
MAKRSAREVAPKAGKSEIVTIRLEPKLRYLAEIAARKHRRSLSSYIEWAIDQSLSATVLDDRVEDDFSVKSVSLADVAKYLWDVDEPDRFVKLALRYPELLTHEEQIIWKLVRENGTLWRGNYDAKSGEFTWKACEEDLLKERLREKWELFCAVAAGNADRSALPTWLKYKQTEKEPEQKPSAKSGGRDLDPEDEIPF